MNLLLDTHTLIWFTEDAPSLSGSAKEAIEDPGNTSLYNVASIWEMTIRLRLGKLVMSRELDAGFQELLESNGFDTLPVTFAHASGVARLPLHHRDPFDRLLVAQAKEEGLAVVSSDVPLMRT